MQAESDARAACNEVAAMRARDEAATSAAREAAEQTSALEAALATARSQLDEALGRERDAQARIEVLCEVAITCREEIDMCSARRVTMGRRWGSSEYESVAVVGRATQRRYSENSWCQRERPSERRNDLLYALRTRLSLAFSLLRNSHASHVMTLRLRKPRRRLPARRRTRLLVPTSSRPPPRRRQAPLPGYSRSGARGQRIGRSGRVVERLASRSELTYQTHKAVMVCGPHEPNCRAH